MHEQKALLITSNYPRWDGDSTTPFVSHLAQDLGQEGWQVDVLAPHAPRAAREEILHGIRVRRFRYLLPESQQTVCYGGGALINLRQHRSNWLKLPFLVLSELWSTIRLLATKRYSVVNAHWIVPQGFVGAIAALLTRTPLVVTVHGGDVFDLKGGVLSRLKSWALNRADAVTTNSSATRQAAQTLAPNATIVTIPMGVEDRPDVDSTDVATLRNRHRRGDGPMLLFVGRLVAEKGIDDLLDAMVALSAELPDATLLVVGTGQDEQQLRELNRELGVDDRVTFTGWVDPQRVATYMAAADVFVGPSKQSTTGWKEGLGLVFLEAMAVGTPVVATNSGGITDIVVHEETGLLVAEAAPAEIAAAVVRMSTDAELVETLTANATDMVVGSYTRRASAVAFTRLFRDVGPKTGSPE